MKATITKAELLMILSEHFNMAVTNVEIVNRIELTLAEKIEAAIRPLAFTSHEKILAVRTLRDLSKEDHEFPYQFGLADSKWAIENFDSFLSFIRHHGRLPREGFSHTGMD